jgi:hypothetical protein
MICSLVFIFPVVGKCHMVGLHRASRTTCALTIWPNVPLCVKLKITLFTHNSDSTFKQACLHAWPASSPKANAVVRRWSRHTKLICFALLRCSCLCFLKGRKCSLLGTMNYTAFARAFALVVMRGFLSYFQTSLVILKTNGIYSNIF